MILLVATHPDKRRHLFGCGDMTDEVDVDNLRRRKLCHACVAESFLRSEIQDHGKRAKCKYCGSIRRCFSIGEMAILVEEAFQEHYIKTASDPDGYEYAMMRDPEIDYSWDRKGRTRHLCDYECCRNSRASR